MQNGTDKLILLKNMPNGGKRIGAGRPKGSKAPHTIRTEALRAYVIDRVISEQESIITALIDKAKNGDVSAAKELLERTIGKVRETVEHTGDFGLDAILHDIQSRSRSIIDDR